MQLNYYINTSWLRNDNYKHVRDLLENNMQILHKDAPSLKSSSKFVRREF